MSQTLNGNTVPRARLEQIELQETYNCVVCKKLLKEPYQSICGCRADFECVKEMTKKLNTRSAKNIPITFYVYTVKPHY